LLLHKREILKLANATAVKGCSLPLLRMYWKGRRVKVEIGVGKGKTHSDQRQDLKKQVELREAQREMSRFNANSR
jgi:SsrA-binding protein